MPAEPGRAVDEALAELTISERGFVLGAVLIGAQPSLLESLASDEAARCQPALIALKTLSAEARAVAVVRLRTEVCAEAPAGLADVHPDWLRKALLPESSVILKAVVAGLPAPVVAVARAILVERGEDANGAAPTTLDDQMLSAIRRGVFADIVSVQRQMPGTAALLQTLLEQGAETLGVSLRGAPRPVIARAAAQIGAPAAQRLLDAAAHAGLPAERQAARARVAAVRPDDAKLGAAIAIGVYRLAETLASSSDDDALALAQRLPLAVGELFLETTAQVQGTRDGRRPFHVTDGGQAR